MRRLLCRALLEAGGCQDACFAAIRLVEHGRNHTEKQHGPMTTAAEELERRVREGVVGTLSAFLIQVSTGPITDVALEHILRRGSRAIVESLSPYLREQRHALLAEVVHLMLETFLVTMADLLDGGPGGSGPPRPGV